MNEAASQEIVVTGDDQSGQGTDPGIENRIAQGRWASYLLRIVEYRSPCTAANHYALTVRFPIQSTQSCHLTIDEWPLPGDLYNYTAAVCWSRVCGRRDRALTSFHSFPSLYENHLSDTFSTFTKFYRISFTSVLFFHGTEDVSRNFNNSRSNSTKMTICLSYFCLKRPYSH